MAGAILERELISRAVSRIEFEAAGEPDDAGVRRLLRENPMAGRISISLEREPNYFADANVPGELKQTIVAKENGRIVCMGNCVIRERFVNGEPRRVGYLGGLRLATAYGGRFDILRRGYDFFHQLQKDAPADFYFTSIAADNERAIRFLERGVRGMPRYQFVGEFTTLLLSAHSGRRRRETLNSAVKNTTEQVGAVNRPDLIRWLDAHNRDYQFAPCWREEQLTTLESLGLKPANFFSLHDGSTIRACGALWDQRSYKQTVVRGYAPWLALVRPVLNVLGRFTGQPQLPATGRSLAIAFVSHLATLAERPEELVKMINVLRGAAAQRQIALLTLGFAAADPRLETMRRNFRFREYHSRIHVVSWPGIGGTARNLDSCLLAPEVALL